MCVLKMCFVYSFEFLVCAAFLFQRSLDAILLSLSRSTFQHEFPSQMKLFGVGLFFFIREIERTFVCVSVLCVSREFLLLKRNVRKNFSYWKLHNFTNQFDLRSCGVST